MVVMEIFEKLLFGFLSVKVQSSQSLSSSDIS